MVALVRILVEGRIAENQTRKNRHEVLQVHGRFKTHTC
jgi:hypothetical protein